MSRILSCLVVILVSRAVAYADVPDSAWLVVKDRPVVVTLTNGTEVRGKPVAIDEHFVTLIDSDSGRVIPVNRAEVGGPRLAQESVASGTTVERHIGLQLYTGPGNLMVDLDFGRFYGFVGGSIGYPIIFSGTSAQYAGGVLALGAQWRLTPTSRWKFDLAGTLLPTWWSGFSMGIGVSAGFHWTSVSGFTVGFKIPVFGLGPGYSTVTGESSSSSSGYKAVNTGALLIANYYLEAAMALPIVSLGYRFK
ncbi:MAG: hypothetical protein ACXVCV_01865 [Polyangia bacterium]